MGYATIVSGGPDGRYTVSLDWGADNKTAVLAGFSTMLAQLELNLAAAEAKVAEVHTREIAMQERINAEIAVIISQQTSPVPGTEHPSDKALKLLLEQRRALSVELYPLRANVARIKFAIAQTQRDIAYWNNIETGEVRQAWCTDFTEDASAGSVVATMDIPGDSSLVVLAPGARAWTPADGQFKAREVMSPSQAFWNAAVLPGWAKFKPTYRWGTITAINYDADTATVALGAAALTDQHLNVNQATTLIDVPVVYMTCHAAAFEVGHNVVVTFQGQDWEDPRIVGFLDNPRLCNGWRVRVAGLSENLVSGTPRYLCAVFQSMMPPDKLQELVLAASSVSADYRVDRGAWITPEGDTGAMTVTSREWSNPLNGFGAVSGGFIIALLVNTTAQPSEDGSSFGGSGPAASYVRVSFFVDSGFAPGAFFAPFLPFGSIIEVRLKADGSTFANVAVKSVFEPFYIDSGARIPGSVTNVTMLDYTRFQEDGT